ncbi:MAG: hypothetical protein JWO05_1541 [Gemmatimonadetes bacterium]|nr:hypothetical protein [Gemmatimonadota bacterium]
MSGPASKSRVIALVLALVNLPLVIAAGHAVTFFRDNRSNGTMIVNGVTRDYVLHVPPGYDRRKPTPLVISMHGAALWGAAQEVTSRWSELADRERFIVVYPSAATGNGPRVWHVDSNPGPGADVAFIAQLLDTLEATYNIDRARVYSNGLSNGGGMSFVLSCAMPDRIAAVGLVAAAQTLPFEWCADRHPVPMMAIHGTSDPQVPYKGSTSWVAPVRFPRVAGWAERWARRNRCESPPSDSVILRDVVRRTWSGCADGASVVLLTVEGGGHTWPGGAPFPEWFSGRTSKDLSASEQLWAFFQQHPLANSRRGRTPR